MWFAASFRSSRNTTQVTKSDRETVYVDGSERRRLLHSKPGWRVADCPIPERDYAAAKISSQVLEQAFFANQIHCIGSLSRGR